MSKEKRAMALAILATLIMVLELWPGAVQITEAVYDTGKVLRGAQYLEFDVAFDGDAGGFLSLAGCLTIALLVMSWRFALMMRKGSHIAQTILSILAACFNIGAFAVRPLDRYWASCEFTPLTYVVAAALCLLALCSFIELWLPGKYKVKEKSSKSPGYFDPGPSGADDL